MYSSCMASLNNRLKQSRGKAGLSQQQLASRAGISRQAYFALESGKATPSTEVALRLARALGTRVDDLFFLADEIPEVTQAELVGASWRPCGFQLGRSAAGPLVPCRQPVAGSPLGGAGCCS